MKREIIIKNCLTTDTEMAHTPATIDIFTGEIELSDFTYGLEGYDDEIEKGLNELKTQFNDKKMICVFRGENVDMVMSSTPSLN